MPFNVKDFLPEGDKAGTFFDNILTPQEFTLERYYDIIYGNCIYSRIRPVERRKTFATNLQEI